MTRRWRQQLHRKEYWRWACLSLSNYNITEVVQSERPKIVDDLKTVDLSENSMDIFLIFCLENLDLSHVNLYLQYSFRLNGFPIESLSQVATRVRKLDLSHLDLHVDQLNTLFGYLNQTEDIKLKSLNLRYLKVIIIVFIPPYQFQLNFQP